MDGDATGVMAAIALAGMLLQAGVTLFSRRDKTEVQAEADREASKRMMVKLMHENIEQNTATLERVSECLEELRRQRKIDHANTKALLQAVNGIGSCNYPAD